MNFKDYGINEYEIDLYAPFRPAGLVDLSANTNRFGLPPSITNVTFDISAFQDYPDLYSDDLRTLLAGMFDVESKNIAIGCGSDDILNASFRAFSSPGDVVTCAVPTFGMVENFAIINRLNYQPVESLVFDKKTIEKLLSKDAQIIYVCSPNNPTGHTITQELLEELIQKSSGLVILDEAYAEFCGQDYTELTKTYDNFLVLRTLSKAWGLAGLRVGYGIGNEKLIKQVQLSIGPFKVTTVAMGYACLAIERDKSWVSKILYKVEEARAVAVKEFETRGFSPLSSEANFLLVPMENVKEIGDDLLKLGVLVRPYVGLEIIGDALRVTIGPQDEMDKFWAAFDETIKNKAGK